MYRHRIASRYVSTLVPELFPIITEIATRVALLVNVLLYRHLRQISARVGPTIYQKLTIDTDKMAHLLRLLSEYK